ncbi:MAG: DUF3769 domain-containing protein [Gloeocapsa sp. UFS-A4-WI-NPMV-4B04]|jgi:hypothetical protein|nr:DUF3769 domain-containing protein [Gloeocapsa sp. UFS-A4-WI-NPMV-4B04]
MTHPVPPPEPPPIIQTLPPANIRLASHTVSAPLSSNNSSTVNSEFERSTGEIQLPTATSTPTPEPSQPSATSSAASLGSLVSVGYNVKRVETIDPPAESTVSNVAARSIQPLPVNRDSSSAIVKLKKITANSSNDTAHDVDTSRSIQPLPVNRDSSSAITKLKKLTAPTIAQTTSDSSIEAQAAPQVEADPNSSNVLESPTQPGELNFQAPVGEPTTAPTPASDQTQPVGEPTTAPIPDYDQTQPAGEPAPALPAPIPNTTPQIESQPIEPSSPTSTPEDRRVLELNSDRQEYDEQREVVTADGNVLLRFDGGVLDADSLRVNLQNLIAVGEGNVAFTRGQQVLRGERLTYNFLQNTGEFTNGSGEIFIPTAGADFSPTLPTDVTAGGVLPRPPSDRITANQPQQQITNTGGIQITGGSSGLPQPAGAVNRVRFQAEQIQFYPQGWQANNVRFTNDPFSPPELEVRADTVTLTRETPYLDRIRTTRQRLVFDQGLSLPIPRNQVVIDRRQRDVSPAIAQVGYDGEDRGGLFVERAFNPIDTERVRFRVTPQFFAQEAFLENGGNIFDPALYGLKSRLDATLGPRTSLTGSATFTSLDLSEAEDNLRASLQLNSVIGTRLPHQVALDYSYRDRIYNGSLGYRTVQRSFGATLASPVIPLGTTGISLSYQAGAQNIKADTDRIDLLEPIRVNNRITLNRFQGSAALNRGFLLWQGKPLPATATEGLRYTPAPVVPYIQAFVGVTGTSSLYSSGDNQTTLTGTVGLQGQFGHFSRKFLDYTNFNISYSQSIINGLSPFLFDRVADTRVLSAGVTQQIYGPFRLGLQAVVNLDTGENISTDYILEYSRRTYGITLRYNPELELGALSLRISDFNWVGGSDAFSDSEIKPVVNGVRQLNE